jgi:hypothetical protein
MDGKSNDAKGQRGNVMQQLRTIRSRLVRLLLVVSLLVCFGGCAKPIRVGVECPRPTEVEVDDYDAFQYTYPYKPTVQWVARMIAYCWPELAELERAE